jgi:hypothetical protein
MEVLTLLMGYVPQHVVGLATGAFHLQGSIKDMVVFGKSFVNGIQYLALTGPVGLVYVHV